ncbi:MAG: hypothetical protein ACI8X5_002476 [Planctomycetota bacterium]|jgi:hypothetical protein
MDAEKFRTLALCFPEASEESHMDHPDFRVCGKVFASLGPDEDWAMLKLTPPEQERLMLVDAQAYSPFKGAWGKRGWTRVELSRAKVKAVREGLRLAWCNTAPKRLVTEHENS